MEKRLKENGHMVIVIAEGAGQELLSESMHTMNQQDASENKLLEDVGLWISQKIKVSAHPFTGCHIVFHVWLVCRCMCVVSVCMYLRY